MMRKAKEKAEAAKAKALAAGQAVKDRAQGSAEASPYDLGDLDDEGPADTSPTAEPAPELETAPAPAPSGPPLGAKPDKPKTGAAKPSAAKPSAPKPSAPKPSAPKPSAAKPSAPKPAAKKPSAPKPAVAENSDSKPEPELEPVAGLKLPAAATAPYQMTGSVDVQPKKGAHFKVVLLGDARVGESSPSVLRRQSCMHRQSGF